MATEKPPNISFYDFSFQIPNSVLANRFSTPSVRGDEAAARRFSQFHQNRDETLKTFVQLEIDRKENTCLSRYATPLENAGTVAKLSAIKSALLNQSSRLFAICRKFLSSCNESLLICQCSPHPLVKRPPTHYHESMQESRYA